jgi:hypothetical protein
MNPDPAALRAALDRDLPDTAWLDTALEQVTASPATIGRLLPAAGRRCGRGPLSTLDGWSADEAARVLLLAALPLRGPRLAEEVIALYHQGDAAEKRAVLKALPLLDTGHPDRQGIGAAAAPLLRDAIRSNDTRLIAAALGPYAAYLDPDTWRQAVLKCVFTGVPLAAVDDLEARADAELGAMLAAFADERHAAGRSLPDDAAALLDRLTAARPTQERVA